MSKVFSSAGKMIGGTVSQTAYDRFGLIALFEETSRSEIVKGLVEKWMETRPKDGSIVYELAKRAYETWLDRGGEQYKEFKLYCYDEVSIALEKRKIAQFYIDEVIETMKQIHKRRGQ